MATSNVYKPGWRSRRRSRLSLVERAVPRLGRGADTENASTLKTPRTPMRPAAAYADQQKKTSEHVDDTSSELTEQRPLQAHDELTKRLVHPPSPPLEEQEGGSTDVDQIASHRTDDAETLVLSDVKIEPGKERHPVEKTVPPSSLVCQSASHEDDGLSTSELPALPEVLEGSWDIESMSAAVVAKVDPTKVYLDWDSLISSGLVDPRDRARPLPANVDEIARALVRQALSDQSGWRDRIVLVSSARESRAKSMAAINFAFALTTINRHSVVLLDANMNGNGVGSHLGAAGRPGLTTALCDDTIEINDIALETNLDQLTFVASGGFEDDILDRFASRRMLEILRFLTKDPDTLLVLDAPPILSSQEATVLSVIAGQVVLVVEAGVTNESSINRALKRIGDRHNVSLVLSESSGAVQEEPIESQTPASRRLALPAPKHSSIRRRLRKAIASFAVGLGIGFGALPDTDHPPPDQGERERTEKKLSQPDSSASSRRLVGLQLGGGR